MLFRGIMIIVGFGITRSKIEQGQVMDILYDPEHPEDVRIGAGTDRSLSLFLVAAGAALIVAAIISSFS